LVLPLCPLGSVAFALSVGFISFYGELNEEEQPATITAAHTSANAILLLTIFLSGSLLRLRRQAVSQTQEQGRWVGHYMSINC
jgi:hypothetical protein